MIKYFALLTILTQVVLGWSFSERELQRFTPKQLENLYSAYLTGYPYDIGYTLAAISIVETRAGKFDFSKNHICGHMQINTRFVSSTCKQLESNPFLASLEAKDNFLFWYKHTKSWTQSVKHYNGGWDTSQHGEEYLRRVRLVIRVLKKSQIFKG